MNQKQSRHPKSRLCLALQGLLALTIFCSPASFGEEQSEVESIAKALDSFGKRLSSLRSDIDRSQFNPDAQLDRLLYDPETIIEFVANEVSFHPYEGLLRGPAGTLQARAGNSLDQSVLLAFLLKSAGYDATVVNGALSESDALRLLKSTANGAVPQSLDYLDDAIENLNASDASESGPETIGDEGLQLQQKSYALEQQLDQYLASASVSLAPRDVTDKLLSRIQPYFWVQHRDDSTLPWQNAHPAFGSIEAPQAMEPGQRFAESIPKEYHHVFTMSAWIEQWEAGSIKKHRVMKPWSSPVANLIGKSLRYHNAPSGLSLETAGDLETALENTNMLVPMFNGVMAPGARAFDMKGRTIDLLTLGGNGSGGIFQTIGDKFEAATTTLADRKDGKPTFALHSMYLEFSFTTPSGQSSTRKRFVLTPRANYDNDQNALWSLITAHDYMVTPGDIPVDLLADRLLETNIHGLDWLKFTILKSFEPDKEIVVPDEVPVDFVPLFQHWTMQQRPQDDPSVIRFTANPALLGIRNGYHDSDTAFTAVDVVFNRVEHVRKKKSGLESAPRASFKAGVWDTLMETVPSQSKSQEGRSITSTVQVFDLAEQQGIETAVLKPGDSERVGQFGLDPNAALFVKEDLEQGFAVIIPSSVPEGANMAAWWRVHPESGETLGMTGDGHGQATLEYISSLVGNSMKFINAVAAIKQCEEKNSMAERLCCLVNAHANSVLGVGFGGWMKASFGGAAAGIFSLTSNSFKITNEVLDSNLQVPTPKVEAMSCTDIPTSW